MGEFLLKNLDKITNSIVDICFDDVVVLDVVTVVTKSYEKFIEFLKNQNLKKITIKIQIWKLPALKYSLRINIWTG